uniref:Chromatin assembly factor 1 subunit A dimerization domain-containing protein n=1 Tax=Peronospora matthiolae TaxID=2874970 RepID=A0AAV1UGJ1_9STRA
MAESKKGVKQATISAFFSPKTTKPVSEDKKPVESELKRVCVKRPRVSSVDANSEVNSEVVSTDRVHLAVQKQVKPKALAKLKAEATGKTEPMLKVKKKKKQRLVRFTSPHAVTAKDEEEEQFDEDDDDVFNTPEAKRARAELETGAGVVPAGALILDDAIVEEEEIVTIGEDDGVVMGEETKGVDEDAASGVVDSAIVPVVDDTAEIVAAETDDDKKTRNSVTTNLSAVKDTQAKAMSMTKRQLKVKELAAAAAESKVARVEPLDPIIQARVDTYKMKTDELTSVYRELSLSEQESDVIMQDIYGVKLDYDLGVIVDESKVQQALIETWQKLQDHARSIPDRADVVVLPATVSFPHEVKCFIVRAIQGRSASLSAVSRGLLAAFKKTVEVANCDVGETKTKGGSGVDLAASLAMEMEIKMLAQRTPHGVRPAKANVYEDTSVAALWVWEVGSLEKYFGDEAQKMIKRMRKHRKRLGQQLKALAKVVQLLHQKPVDETKVSAEEAKVGKFGLVVATELQKARDKEVKMVEKRTVAEEKKLLDKRRLLERQEAKDEEKRKRDREVEEKELESFKAQKKFKSFFAAAAANGSGTCDSITDVTGDDDELQAVHPESRSTTIARMDAAIGFLGSAANPSLGDPPGPSFQSSVSMLKKGKRGTTSNTDLTSSSSSWSGRRHCDPKLGVMKLLQFYENNRPAYYGTFSKRSRLFRGGRRPFTQYSKFDYSVDSDDEWEEEEPGESLSDDENDGDESDEDNLDYDDQWLAYEDEVDYMDDADKEADLISGEALSSPTKHKLPSQLEKKRRAVKSAKLEPQIIGPFWCVHGGDNCTGGHFPELAGELLSEPAFESSLMKKAREYEEEQKRIEAVRQAQQQQLDDERLKQERQKAQGKDNQEKTGTATAAPETQAASSLVPQQANAIKTLASVEPTPAAACLQSSPPKAPKQIDSWFKKIASPVPTAPPPTTATLTPTMLSQLPRSAPPSSGDKTKSTDESSPAIDVIEVDGD